jgi:16S rRNA (guanine1207-N2)-methyltransferase
MAWDAADEYLLDYCAAELELPGKSVLIADDTFGALGSALSAQSVEAIHYSANAVASLTGNLGRNGLPEVEPLDWMHIPLERRYDLVLMRIPKSIDLLRDHCQRLRPHMNPGAVLVGGAMEKYLSKGMLEALTASFGPTHTTLGRRKARLTVSRFDPSISAQPVPVTRYRAEPFDISVCSYAGVFSASQLDIGTRFFLQQFDAIPLASSRHIADLACGTGVLGIAAAKVNPRATVSFYDDSSVAIQSARESVEENFSKRERFRFHHQDGLMGCPPHTLDLVLCNPPFHAGQQQDTGIAERLFGQAREGLKPGGELWVVGNRHLGYHVKLKKTFSSVEVIGANPKFVVLRCQAA